MSDLHEPAGEREPHRRRESGAWVGAAILIGVGMLFLLRNLGYPMPENWWALFLLIPIVASLAAAWRVYDRARAFNGAVAASLVAAALLIGLMVVFLLDMDINWDLLWPAALVLLGLTLLLRSARRR